MTADLSSCIVLPENIPTGGTKNESEDKNQPAAVVNGSSFLGFIPKKSAPVYCATKAAVHAFSKSLRYQLADTTIKVFEVVPPLVDTAMTQGQPKPKIAPEALAREVLQGIRADRYEIRVGRTKALMLLNRLFPAVVDSMVRDK